VLREAELLSGSAPGPIEVKTLYLGGGTPSLIPAEWTADLLEGLRSRFTFDSRGEVTLEANPEGLDVESLRVLHAAGVNRLSLGMQSGQDHLLRSMTRNHTSREVVQAVEAARRAGFENLSLDLIVGVPGQDLRSWRSSLELALALDPEHLSLYGLTVEPGTPFARWAGQGLLDIPDGDQQANLLDYAAAALEKSGYQHYEIANWSRPGRASAHNLRYWRMQPYLGLGAAAHGFTGAWRTENTASLDNYLAALGSKAAFERPFPETPATAARRRLDRETLIEETLIMGLRLVEEGIQGKEFYRTFQVLPEEVYPRELKELTAAGLLESSGGNLKLTHRGRLLANQVFSRLIR
jgi:oxygen-independent coproporphyrinogen-3 oxidase